MSSGWHRNIHILELFCLCAFHANHARGLIYEFVGMVSTMTNKLLFAEIHNNADIIVQPMGRDNSILRITVFYWYIPMEVFIKNYSG